MAAESVNENTKLAATSAGSGGLKTSITRSPSNSRSRTRPRYSRQSSFLPENTEALVSIDGTVGEETADLLHEFVHPHHHHHETEETLIEDVGQLENSGDIEGGSPENNHDEDISEEWKGKPWYRRPSPWWIICMMPFSAIAMTATLAPRIEIYTYLACIEHKPEYTVGKNSLSLSSLSISTPASANALSFTAGSLAGSDYMSLPFIYTPSSTNNFVEDYNTHFSTEDYLSISSVSWNSTDKVTYIETINGEVIKEEDDEDDEDPNRCASDPEVEASVAKFIVIMSLAMGILSCLTTGWWGSFSDRYGRLKILGISVVGLLLTDYNFIFVMYFSKYLPGHYYFLLLGPLVEGALGGLNSAVAASHAYIADCTSPHSRSRVFSLSVGLLFVGTALGPTIGGLLIKLTGSLMSVFWLTSAVHTVYACLVWFVIPESLEKKRMEKARIEKKRVERERMERDSETRHGFSGFLDVVVTKSFGFLSPLAALAPRNVDGLRSGKKWIQRKDWNMVLIGLSHGASTMMFASYQYKFQYLSAQFHWTSEELGYLVSLAGATRAAYLTLILPIAIKFLKKSKPPIQFQVEDAEPLHPERASPVTTAEPPELSITLNAPTTSSSTSPPSSPSTSVTTHDPSFDLSLAKFSLTVDFVAFAIMPLVLYPAPFIVLTALVSFGAGFGPALQSLALELFSRHNENETGRLFGALSVISAISSQIIGPALFGLTYMKTVATFPRAIFFLSASVVGIALLSLFFIRLPKEEAKVHFDPEEHLETPAPIRPELDRERTLVDTLSLERGRKPNKMTSPELAV